jgi:hypothetical protein
VSCDEAQWRISRGHGAENFSGPCHVALNLLRRDKSVKISVKRKRLNPGSDRDYLLRLIGH